MCLTFIYNKTILAMLIKETSKKYTAHVTDFYT